MRNGERWARNVEAEAFYQLVRLADGLQPTQRARKWIMRSLEEADWARQGQNFVWEITESGRAHITERCPSCRFLKFKCACARLRIPA